MLNVLTICSNSFNKTKVRFVDEEKQKSAL